MTDHYPQMPCANAALPDKARVFLAQAMESLHAPAGAVMLCASAVDAMLKAHALVNGSLNARIDQAHEAHLITEGMAAWAHDVRLDANDQRHADATALLPSIEDARRCIDFTEALGELLFVLPARVTHGRKEAATAGVIDTSTNPAT